MDVSVASDFIRGDFLYALKRGYFMNNLKFIQLHADRTELCQTFSELMAAYNQELDAHMQCQTPTELLAKWTASIIRMQGPKDRHLEL